MSDIDREDRFDFLEMPDDIPCTDEREAAPDHEIYDASHYLKRGNGYMRTGYFDEALRDCARALKEDPMQADAWVNQMLCMIDMNEMFSAVAWEKKADKFVRKNPRIMAAGAIARARVGDRTSVFLAAEALRKGDPNDWLIWLARGESRLLVSKKQNYPNLLKAMEIAPEDEYVPYRVATAFHHFKIYRKAFGFANEASKRDPENPLFLYELGRILLELGRKDEALRSLDQAVRIHPGWSVAAGLRHRAHGGDSISSLLNRIKSFFRS